MRDFWEDLKWPNPDDSINIATNTCGDICRFAIIYFETVTARVEKSEVMKNVGIFKVPSEVYVVINNVNFISQGIQKLIVDLTEQKIDEHIRTQKMVENALKYGKSRIARILEMSIDHMVPTLRKLMTEGADGKEIEIGDRLFVYIEDSLLTLHDELIESDFLTAKNILWKFLLNVLSELIQRSLACHRHPVFFSNLRMILSSLREVFKSTNDDMTDDEITDRITQIDHLLERYGLNTANLIHQYYKDRYQMQQNISQSSLNPFGVLSIHCFFFNNTLKLEILNARNLIPIGANRKCDSFVKISIIPEAAFPKYQNYKTCVELDTHFPLYDELFEL